MAYNPYPAVKKIYDLKGAWESADKSNNTAAKNNISAEAKRYYNQLKANRFGDVADQLSASNYAQSKAIHDKWATMGKNPARSYLYTLGQQYGMTQGDIDGLLSWNDLTGEVSFGGKKIGTPEAEVDGVSYWSDTSVLDDAFSDYISRTGTVRTPAAAVAQENESLFKKYDEEYEYLKETNPFETEVGKSILAKYDLAGMQGRDNAAASGAASNGGNIDSFAAANALRQQASIISQGQTAALNAHQQRLDNARTLLSDMGVNIERVFNEDQTAQNNDVAKKLEIASVKGYVPTEWSIQNDAFLRNFVDGNGNLKAEYQNVDFQELINNAKAKGDAELANKYAILRGLKIFGNFSEYGKYLKEGDVAYITPQRTAEYDLTNEQIVSAERIASGNNATQLSLADKQALAAIEAAKAQADASAFASGQLDIIKTALTTSGTGEGPLSFVDKVLVNLPANPSASDIQSAIITNTREYNIDVEDARIICLMYGISTAWLDDYVDYTNDDLPAGYENRRTGKTVEGQHSGMYKKS